MVHTSPQIFPKIGTGSSATGFAVVVVLGLVLGLVAVAVEVTVVVVVTAEEVELSPLSFSILKTAVAVSFVPFKEEAPFSFLSVVQQPNHEPDGFSVFLMFSSSIVSVEDISWKNVVVCHAFHPQGGSQRTRVCFYVGPERLHLGLKVGLPVVFAGSSMFFVRSLLIVVDLFVSYFVILLC